MISSNNPAVATAETVTISNKFPGNGPSPNEIEALMRRILQGNDYAAFKRLFSISYDPLCQFCFRFVQVREVAEELVSDVFLTIWKNRERIQVTSAKAYLFTAVRNRGFDYLRKKKQGKSCTIDYARHIAADYPNAQDRMVESELAVSVEQSVAALPKQCRLIFELSREEGLKYKEIATKLDISIKTVETQMGRALKHLRESLQPVID